MIPQRPIAMTLLLLGVSYVAAGCWRLWSQSVLTDFVQRVNGLMLIRAGSTPYTLDYRAVADAPWAWLGNLLLYWPPAMQRVYYGLLIVGVLLLIVSWAYRIGERARPGGGLMLAGATLAMSSVVTALGLGQNSPFMVAALVGCYMLVANGHPVAAGLCLGFALAKPQISLLFVLPLLVTGQFLALAVAAAYVVVATLLVCSMTGLTPIELTRDWQVYIAGIKWPGYGPYQVLIDAGLPERAVLVSSALVFGGAATAAIAVLRDRPLLVLFAIAAVAGRLWSYHQLYDNLMIVFLLVALGELALRSAARPALIMFLLVGVTVWAPGRFCDVAAFQWFQMFTWLAGAGMAAAASTRAVGDVRTVPRSVMA